MIAGASWEAGAEMPAGLRLDGAAAGEQKNVGIFPQEGARDFNQSGVRC